MKQVAKRLYLVVVEVSSYIYSGRIFSVKTAEHTLPSGRKASVDFVEHPGAVAILPVLDRDNIVLVKQYRPVIRSWIYEVPAGTLVSGESPYGCAVRELREETGFSAGHLVKMFEMYMAPGYSTELLHGYLAEGLKKGEARLEKDEELTVEVIPLKRAEEMINRNEIRDSKTIATILYYVKYGG